MEGRRNGNDFAVSGDYILGTINDVSGEDQEESPAAKRANEYARSLLAEKLAIDQDKHPLAYRLLDQELSKAQSEGRGPKRDDKFVDVYNEKPTKVCAKVLVPLKEHPRFNFVGKLLGPKGNSLKRLQEETMCRMAVLGRGSIKDREKEEELRNSMELKYAHLSDDLHVDISSYAPPAEAYARVAFALTEIQKYLIPDGSDEISIGQLREMEIYEERPPGPKGRAGPPGGGPLRHPGMRGGPSSRPSRGHPHSAPRMPPSGGSRGMPGKSILNRARGSMNSSYGESFGESYESESRPSHSGFGGNPFGGSDYDTDYFAEDRVFEDNETQHWRPFKSGGSAGGNLSGQPRFRSGPYTRPTK